MARESSYDFLRERNIMVLISCRILWGLTQALFNPYFSLFALAQQGVTPELLGVAVSVKAVGTAVLAPLAGYMADFVGRKKVIFVGTALHATSYLLYFYARDFQMIFIGSLIEGMSVIHFPALQAITHDSLVRSRRGLGVSTTTGLQALPSLISPLVGGILAEKWGIDQGMRVGFLLAFGMGLAVASIRLRFLRETLENNHPKVGANALPSLLKESYRAMFAIFREFPALRGLVILAMVETFFGALVAPFWIVYAETAIGLSTVEWGLIEVAASGTYTAFLLFSGRFTDHYGARKVMLMSFLIAPAMNLSFIYCQNFAQVLFFRMLLAVQNAFTMPASSALMADIIPREHRGRAIAAIGWQPVIMSLGAITHGFFRFPPYLAGSILSGYVFSLNPRFPWFLLAAGYVLGFTTCLLAIRQPEKPAD